MGSPASQEQELTAAFGRVAHGRFANDQTLGNFIHTSVVPDLYTWTPKHSPMISRLRGKLDLPKIWEISTIQGIGFTQDQSVDDLYEKIATQAMTGSVVLLQKDNGQDGSSMVMGKSYKSVHHKDKDHSHHSPRLANFVSVAYHPFMGFELGSMQGAHCHLKIGQP